MLAWIHDLFLNVHNWIYLHIACPDGSRMYKLYKKWNDDAVRIQSSIIYVTLTSYLKESEVFWRWNTILWELMHNLCKEGKKLNHAEYESHCERNKLGHLRSAYLLEMLIHVGLMDAPVKGIDTPVVMS